MTPPSKYAREAAATLVEYAGFKWSADHLDMAITATQQAFAEFELLTIERCAKAMCSWCAQDWPINAHGHHYDPGHSTLFKTETCDAAFLRAIIQGNEQDD